MRFSVAILLLLIFATGCQQPRAKNSAPAAVSASTGPDAFFRDELNRFGEWTEVPDLGTCWYPTNIAPGWRPYSDGRWVYTDGVGWLWVGAEPWSWACDHYGRWTFADSHGWVWVAGKQWSPAWVALRGGSGYVGWAPLSPLAKGSSDLDVSHLQTRDILLAAFSFVPEKYFADPRLKDHLEPVTRNVTLLDLTQDVTRYEVVDDRVIHRGIAPDAIESAAGVPIQHFVVVEIDRPRPQEIRGGDVSVYRPRVVPPDTVVLKASTKTKPINAELMAAQRQRQEEYHQQARELMDQRHEKELAALPATGGSITRGELEVRHAREQQAFEEEREREVEALRRLQRDQRERHEQQQAPTPADSAGPHKYEIPPEWQLPADQMVPPAAKSPNPKP